MGHAPPAVLGWEQLNFELCKPNLAGRLWQLPFMEAGGAANYTSIVVDQKTFQNIWATHLLLSWRLRYSILKFVTPRRPSDHGSYPLWRQAGGLTIPAL